MSRKSQRLVNRYSRTFIFIYQENALTPSEIGKILVFINDSTNQAFINQIAGRSSDQWAKKSPKKISDALQHSDKYEAVNTAHRNTIETSYIP